MSPEQELEQLGELLRRWGAAPSQSEIMAKQLVKRAEQLVETRGMDRAQAMQQLLEIVRNGREGGIPPG